MLAFFPSRFLGEALQTSLKKQTPLREVPCSPIVRKKIQASKAAQQCSTLNKEQFPF